jgi:two-component sensor histidine kinase
VISSLLHLQSGYVDDDATKEMFIESQNRVRSMALIHERLYRTESLVGVEFGQYLESLTRSLMFTYGAHEAAIDLQMNVDPGIHLGMDTAVPCGLIVNELVTNALKHGFDTKTGGIITISLEHTNAEADPGARRTFQLTIDDSGRGLPDSFDIEQSETLGLQLVTTLVEQLDGDIEVESNSGSKFIINFVEL